MTLHVGWFEKNSIQKCGNIEASLAENHSQVGGKTHLVERRAVHLFGCLINTASSTLLRGIRTCTGCKNSAATRACARVTKILKTKIKRLSWIILLLYSVSPQDAEIKRWTFRTECWPVWINFTPDRVKTSESTMLDFPSLRINSCTFVPFSIRRVSI